MNRHRWHENLTLIVDDGDFYFSCFLFRVHALWEVVDFLKETFIGYLGHLKGPDSRPFRKTEFRYLAVLRKIRLRLLILLTSTCSKKKLLNPQLFVLVGTLKMPTLRFIRGNVTPSLYTCSTGMFLISISISTQLRAVSLEFPVLFPEARKQVRLLVTQNCTWKVTTSTVFTTRKKSKTTQPDSPLARSVLRSSRAFSRRFFSLSELSSLSKGDFCYFFFQNENFDFG